MITEDEFRRLKRQVEDARTSAAQAKGALDQLMTQLKSEFECDTLKEAKEKLTDLEAKKTKAQKRFEDEMKTYEKKWKPND